MMICREVWLIVSQDFRLSLSLSRNTGSRPIPAGTFIPISSLGYITYALVQPLGKLSAQTACRLFAVAVAVAADPD